MKILITGGAGYIGSFMIKRLLDENHTVVSIDNLKRGYQKISDTHVEFIEGDLLNKDFVKSVFSKHVFDGVIHFAGFISMTESMENPGIYFENNVYGAINILEEMKNKGSNNFIFSSTAGVYGNPITIPITEDHVKEPMNPYGESKLMVERILRWYSKIYGINSVSLRYFNAAGASSNGDLGETHTSETHIIPKAIKAALQNEEFILYGDDYNTKDGSCVRDYIHVLDLVEAHVLALKKLQREKGFYAYNVGTGKGHTNKEIIDTIQKISGLSVRVKIEKRRPGDVETLIADPTKIQKELNFSPIYSDLETIITSALKWHKNQKPD